MRSLTTLSLLLASTASVMSAEIKGSSRIDAVTVYPSGAEVTRIGRVTIERGEHVVLFSDLPAQALSGSLRVEGKATGTLEIGSPIRGGACAALRQRRRRNRGASRSRTRLKSQGRTGTAGLRPMPRRRRKC